MIFYLGTHEAHWLARTAIPLFVSRRRLARYRTLPTALGPWALDSGGFTELKEHGRWTIGPEDYVAEARRYRDAVGNLRWAAIQDWMCEPFILAQTGKDVRDHQRLTIDSYARLADLAPEMPWVPVLQGWEIDDYLDHAADYRAAGFDLHAAPVVGVGSVCRRQGTGEIAELFVALRPLGFRLHGFGVKTLGLRAVAGMLESSDSLAWSYRARRAPGPMSGCTHRKCNHCLRFALAWRDRVLTTIRRPQQVRFAW